MNLKKAKKIRQEFRAQGTDVRQRKYQEVTHNKRDKNKDGKDIIILVFQTVLEVACPRYQYKKVKEAINAQH